MLSSGLINEKPVNDIKRIPITSNKVYFFLEWKGISEGEHEYRCAIYDAENQIVEDHKIQFYAKSNTHYTWSWHNFNPKEEVPGKWKFLVWLNDKKVLAVTFNVLSSEEAEPAKEKEWQAGMSFNHFTLLNKPL